MTSSYDIALFAPSDGLTPIQAKKLNSNFQRLLDLISGKEEGGEASVKLTATVRSRLEPVIMDAAFPIGCLVFAKDITGVPAWGKWREVDDYNNRFIRIGTVAGSTGGSSSQTITPQLPKHTHTYTHTKQVIDTKVKVDVSTKSDAKEVAVTLKDSTITSDTGSAGADPQPQTISTIPPYVTLKLFERYE